MDVKTLLEKPFVLLDGAMGTMLQKKGVKSSTVMETLSITSPEWIEEIHRAYRLAGSDILYANTFGANRLKLEKTGYTVEEIVSASMSIAKRAADGALCALDIGPTGKLLEPNGSLSFEDAYDVFSEVVQAGVRAGADLIAIETMTDLYEMRAALLAAKENSDLPVICTMTFEADGRTFTGTDIYSAAVSMTALGADAIGINCSLGPKEAGALVRKMHEITDLPTILKPNAGLPDPTTGAYNVDALQFAREIAEAASYGISFVGGCCGTTPEYIREVKQALAQIKPVRQAKKEILFVCSATKTVAVDRVRVIGERINPTGKKRFKEALVNREIDYILSQGLSQVEAGADILDVNVGLPQIDENEMMVTVVKSLQSVIDVPLQIDSSSAQVIASALRVYNGKAIVNSVNGDDEVLDTVLPLVKRYGAAVVGLTLDAGGIRKTAEERFAIAKKIVDRALFYGIARNDICIDCLTLTASAEQEAAMETIRAVRMVREQLHVNAVLGVSNISFGLPNRPLVNRTFLTLAMGAGLNLPIMNPNDKEMMDAVRAYSMLSCDDRGANEFVAYYGSDSPQKKVESAPADPRTLEEAVFHGLRGESASLTKTLLESNEPMTIVNTMLIPALDRAGELFESGKLFLPQLIQCAQAAQASFGVIREMMASKGEASVSKGKIILATVKGDIHDIGKNIVKVLLENYGFTVIDLGRDVDPELIVKTAKEMDVSLVGLSALMTTTLASMEKTVIRLKEEKPDCTVLVGGAVLTPEYAQKIGADYYAKDAKESVDIAQRVLCK